VPNTAPPYTYLCFSSEGKHGTEVLLVKRRLIQKWSDGRPSDPAIPQWAGQWGFICAPQGLSQQIVKSAYAACLAQTGIDLNDPLVKEKYYIDTIEPKTLQNANYNPVPVLYIICHADGMQALHTAIEDNIEARKIQDGVLETIAVKRISEAKTLIGPVLPPPEGWKPYVIKHYYGGNPPKLNPPIDAQTQVMTERSKQSPAGFQVVIENTPSAEPPSPEGTPVKTTVQLINATPLPIGLSAAIGSAADWASQSLRPDVNLAKVDLAGFATTTVQLDVSSKAASAIYTLTVNVPLPSGDGREQFYFWVDQTQANTATPDLEKATELPSGGHYIGPWGVLQVAGTTKDGLPGLTLYIVTPGGSEPCPTG
jgi:hypothetical protein